jgi:hypothetical protein
MSKRRMETMSDPTETMTYGDLLLRSLPAVIESEAENENPADRRKGQPWSFVNSTDAWAGSPLPKKRGSAGSI